MKPRKTFWLHCIAILTLVVLGKLIQDAYLVNIYVELIALYAALVISQK